MDGVQSLIETLDLDNSQSFALLRLLDSSCEGSVLVDRDCRIVWVSEKYQRLLDLPGQVDPRGLDVESLIPNSLMRQVVNTGRAQLLDLMRFKQRWFVVTRLPLRDQSGQVCGALGLVFFDELAHLRPLVDKYTRLQLPRQKPVEGAASRQTRYSFADLIGSSNAMLALRQQALRVAPLNSTVLLLGETGTGKELLAQAIHSASPRTGAPFVSINTAALPETLVEAELFGAAAGAYTGADPKGRIGKFELAQGGTLFLDEIGEMSAAVQSKLLRALQEREIEPVGCNRVIPIDVRVIAATSRNLEQLVADGGFRADLYYRLNVLPLLLPPLRERLEDLPQLVDTITTQLSQQLSGEHLIITDWLIQAFAQYHWPGNIRELRNVLERATLFSDHGQVTETLLANFLPSIQIADRQDEPESEIASTAVNRPPLNLSEQIAATERRAILAAIDYCQGNKLQAAKLLGISRAALYEKFKRLGL
ncbi:MAG: sigma 54-interacting transcriptional regulator [Motiliproteus sp.]